MGVVGVVGLGGGVGVVGGGVGWSISHSVSASGGVAHEEIVGFRV